jgi:hypothetical protein
LSCTSLENASSRLSRPSRFRAAGGQSPIFKTLAVGPDVPERQRQFSLHGGQGAFAGSLCRFFLPSYQPRAEGFCMVRMAAKNSRRRAATENARASTLPIPLPTNLAEAPSS